MITKDDLIFVVTVLCFGLLLALGLAWAQEIGLLKITEDDDAE